MIVAGPGSGKRTILVFARSATFLSIIFRPSRSLPPSRLVDATTIASASEDDAEGHWVKHKGKTAVHGSRRVSARVPTPRSLSGSRSRLPTVNDGRPARWTPPCCSTRTGFPDLHPGRRSSTGQRIPCAWLRIRTGDADCSVYWFSS